MNNAIPKPIVTMAFAFLWCFYQVMQLILAGFLAMALFLFYEWLFPPELSRYYIGKRGFVQIIEHYSWTKYLVTMIVIFVVMNVFRWFAGREEDERVALIEAHNEAKLKEDFGESASISPDGAGYSTKVTRNGKEFEASHQVGRLKVRGIETSTASALVKFQIADKALEMRIAQKAFWFSPKTEPLSIVPRDEGDQLETLAHRYDCYCSDRQLMADFISDADVQRELLPKFPNPRERSTLTIKNGEATVECGSETKYERAVGEAAGFELMKKLLARAEIFDRRLSEIGKH